MIEKITKIDLILPSPNHTEQILKNLFPDYKIKYKKFPDIWEITNNQFKHSIWYYNNKKSLVKTTLAKEYKEQVIVNVILILVFVSLIIIDEKFNWIENRSIIILAWFIIVLLSNSIIWILKPKYKREFTKEHDSIVSKIVAIKK